MSWTTFSICGESGDLHARVHLCSAAIEHERARDPTTPPARRAEPRLHHHGRAYKIAVLSSVSTCLIRIV
jgi:hypothetical protein